MKVRDLKLSEINVDPDNTRVHDKENIKVIKQSLLKYGQYRPFIIQKAGMIIRVGNGMYQAMLELGWKEGGCLIRDMDDEEATTLSILDNKSSDLSYFDDAKLVTELAKLSDSNIDLTGFKVSDIGFSKFNIKEPEVKSFYRVVSQDKKSLKKLKDIIDKTKKKFNLELDGDALLELIKRVNNENTKN